MSKCNRCGQEIVFAGQDEGGKWIINNPDGTRHVDQQRQGGRGFGGKSPAEQHDIRREATLNAAVAYVVGKAQASGPEEAAKLNAKVVVDVARAFLAFVEEGRPS